MHIFIGNSFRQEFFSAKCEHHAVGVYLRVWEVVWSGQLKMEVDPSTLLRDGTPASTGRAKAENID